MDISRLFKKVREDNHLKHLLREVSAVRRQLNNNNLSSWHKKYLEKTLNNYISKIVERRDK